MNDLAKRVFVVTGATSGIGRATALQLAKLGASVVGVGRDVERGAVLQRSLERSSGGGRFFRADVTQEADVTDCIAEVIRLYGGIDGAVNAAGGDAGGLGQPLAAVEPAQFQLCLQQNLESTFLCMRAELRAICAQKPRPTTIVNVASINGLGAAPGAAAYSAAKAGVLALTKAAAMEYASAEVRVNAVVPGQVDTALLDRVLGPPKSEARTAALGQLTSFIPLKRIGQPDEIAAAILWLCSDASAFVTGNSLIVDGGMTAYAR